MNKVYKRRFQKRDYFNLLEWIYFNSQVDGNERHSFEQKIIPCDALSMSERTRRIPWVPLIKQLK